MSPMLKASFVRTLGERDRIYVTRSDGSEVSWVFATYGDMAPHDMIHLVVESAFGLKEGFWGRVDRGVDPGAIQARANRIGGRDKYAAFGDNLSQLQFAELLANAGWLPHNSSADEIENRIITVCRDSGISPPANLSTKLTAEVYSVLIKLSSRWKGLVPKGAIQLRFSAADPYRGFLELLGENRTKD